jgi:hypothetical protein
MESRNRKANSAARWLGCFCGIWLVGLVVVSGACRDPVGTALYVTIDFPPSLLMDQLLVSGTVAGSGIGPQYLPEQPERILANGDSFRVLLPSAVDKSEAELTVEGLREGTRVAMGTGTAQIQEGSEVDITVHLEPATPPPPPPPPDGGVPDGGPTDPNFCPNCASGCCQGGICTTSTFNTCGSGGVACKVCDGRADSCAAAGFCACGRGPACDPRTTDRCAGGVCRCGLGFQCALGQECVSGRCECTANSCSGCCTTNNTCEPGNTKDVCGRGGADCRKCNRTCGPQGTCT